MGFKTRGKGSFKGGQKQEWKTVPEGSYRALLEKYELKSTKSGNGHYIQACFKIMEGPEEGNAVFHKFLIDHPSEKAVGFAEKLLDFFIKATGETRGLKAIKDKSGDIKVDELETFMAKPVSIKVGVEETEQWGTQNKLFAFYVA